ncbi:MAG: 50S ribosomal protein L9 [Candidatus Omnitrophica bacterium]|nr:50S ribosomal protein L9 [Candidatus Omnitrophota bacterium]MBU4488234.1 50S ribosomal protein L9 [Candidatus Omnitrophota bacterium]MCG2704682.1 50S ribosomal protein L9 [Candidatus Omnitrophota bacterium]
MKLILISDVDKLGKMGDVVNVADGFAQNYLLPKNLAIKETKDSLRVLEEKKRKYAKEIQKEKAKFEEMAKKISAASFTISVACGEEDKLFGSVTAEDIADAFSLENIQIDKKQLNLKEPIKKLGVYQVEVKLHPEIVIAAKIWVVKK